MNKVPQRIVKKIGLLFLTSLLICGSLPSVTKACQRARYMSVSGLIDLRTTFSDGDHSIEELARIARSRGFKENQTAHMGDTIAAAHPPVIRFRVSYDAFRPRKMTLLLIRGGKVIQTYREETPIDGEYIDKEAPPGRKTFYRLMDANKRLVTNPIFVNYRP